IRSNDGFTWMICCQQRMQRRQRMPAMSEASEIARAIRRMVAAESRLKMWVDSSDAKMVAETIDRLAAELARVTAERDKLIERWPNTVGKSVEEGYIDGLWRVYGGTDENGDVIVLGVFQTRTEAVWFAAGLDEPKP
ncbi:MAG: hypothetical protein KGL39_24935, partial [Patescibacteria group bacterium]|nr:hypothetical protein [Patescibacteria group bacterium]